RGGWAAARSVARWKDDRPLRRWRATAREAAKQARRPWVPEVSEAVTTADLYGPLLVLHEEAASALSTVELPAGDLTLVVGPEGGVAPEELAAFVAAGGGPGRVGPEGVGTSAGGGGGRGVVWGPTGRWG